MEKTLGGDRLGSGKKMKVELHNYERSTHDLGYIWRSTMSAGTLVPFLKEIALPGDTFDIKLDCNTMTHPTLGPLFGSYKVAMDIFEAPLRLYQAQLHNNKLGIGMKMKNVLMPVFYLRAPKIPGNRDWLNSHDIDNYCVNPSAILAYLGIRGTGIQNVDPTLTRKFGATPLIMYWDIYKNYYANKQEQIGAVIHNEPVEKQEDIQNIDVTTNGITTTLVVPNTVPPVDVNETTLIKITPTGATVQDISQIVFQFADGRQITGDEMLTVFDASATPQIIYTYNFLTYGLGKIQTYKYTTEVKKIKIKTFDLSNIDQMREEILAAPTSTAFDINAVGLEPYDLAFAQSTSDQITRSISYTQEGLALKTYQSDLLNNWLNTEQIDGTGGITDITSVDTSSGKFSIDTINLAQKVYKLLNRILVSGGSYDDWQDAVWSQERYIKCETPMYHGGLIKELVFQEVVSTAQNTGQNAATTNQPLGTLAGRGTLYGGKHKGGNVTIKVSEPSYILGIVSLTPRIDYSQGNDWDTHLLTMDDLHKPQLDEIGFQELITEQMAWWDTYWNGTKWVTKSAGKQPAWVNYMTQINKVRGNFAIQHNEMFMILNRSYTAKPVTIGAYDVFEIKDLTTYIDPTLFNHIFAETKLDSQNFWVQISVDMTVRRKISAKIMPNL